MDRTRHLRECLDHWKESVQESAVCVQWEGHIYGRRHQFQFPA